MSTTQRNERAESTKSHASAVSRNGTNGTYHPHHASQRPSPQQHQHLSTSQPQQPSPHQSRHPQPSPHDAIARIKSESLNGSQQLMMGVPPANTPDQRRGPAVNGEKVNGHPAGPDSAHGAMAAAPTTTTMTTTLDLKGKKRDLDVPIEQLEQELPLEEADLVPLAALVERLANYGYEALQNLAETLPSLPSSSRRAKVFSTALDVRKQFLKLLVLARWSKDIGDLQKARNIISLLSEQQWQHEDVFAGLTDVRKILPNARMRNADLPTAIDVLRLGTYRRLPASIKDMVVPPKPFTDDEVIEIVAQLEHALRLRMACREIVPSPMCHYRIQDGKVHFRVPGLFEAQVTASGSGDAAASSASTTDGAGAADRWWLLDLKFDIRIVGSNAEAAIAIFPRRPKKAYRERLRVWGDHELEPRPLRQEQVGPDDEGRDLSGEIQVTQSAASKVETDTEAGTHEGETQADGALGESSEPLGDANQPQVSSTTGVRDAPLVRLYGFLQERSLHYQMDILQYQARQLMRLNWGNNLRIETQERPRTLTLHYWTGAQAGAASNSQQGASSSKTGPARGGALRISIADRSGNAGKKRIVADLIDSSGGREEAAKGDSATEATSGRDDVATGKTDTGAAPFLVRRRYLQVAWQVDAAVKAEAEYFDLEISPHALDLERLLTDVVQRHAAALLRILRKQVLLSEHVVSKGLRPQDCTICRAPPRRKEALASVERQTEYLCIDLLGASQDRQLPGAARSTSMPLLALKIDAVSGRLQIEADTEAKASQKLAEDRIVSRQERAAFLNSYSAGPLAAKRNSARLHEASERINASVDAMLDSLHRLQIFARVEEWERQASYIGLRTLRKLSLKPTEYPKFGPLLASCGPPALYVSLGGRFSGFYLALQPSEATSVNVALLSTAQLFEGPGAPSIVIQSIEWLDRARIASAGASGSTDRYAVETASGKRKRSSQPMIDGDVRGGEGELDLEELAALHSYSVALISYAGLEQQLRGRNIPYVHVAGLSGTSASLKLSRLDARRDVADGQSPDAAGSARARDAAADVDLAVAAIVPTLCLRSIDLFGPAKAHLAKRNISLQIREWWDKTKVRAEIGVKLSMKSRRFGSFSKVAESSLQGQPGPYAADGKDRRGPARIEFNGRTSVLTYTTPDLDNCLVGFLVEWQRICPSIELAREVLNVGRSEAKAKAGHPDAIGYRLELVDFDFSAVTFAYGRGPQHLSESGEDGSGPRRPHLVVRVRWQEPSVTTNQFTGLLESASSGYQLDFGACSAGSADPASWFDEQSSALNPHRAIVRELRRAINAASPALDRTSKRPDRVWKGFFQLLRDTLPIVCEVQPLIQGCLENAECPELEIKSATWYRVQFLDRYALDIRLTTHSRVLLCDASQPLFRSPVKGLDTTSAALSSSNDALFTLDASAALFGDSAKASKEASEWTRLESTGQYLAIPDFGTLLRAVCNKVPAQERTPSDLVDLRRALLCSASDKVVSAVLPALIAAIREKLSALDSSP